MPPAPGAPPSDAVAEDAAGCARMFAEFARGANPRAPLYARLAAGIAGDESIAGLLLHAPPRQRQPVLFLACVHSILLGPTGRHDALARWYPNLTARPSSGDPVPALRAFCVAHRAELEERLATRSTQTNEIGRCALLLPAFGMLAAEVGALAHLDVGTSAGLNLLLDRYHYRYVPGGEVGGPSPVTLECEARREVPVPTAMPEIVERRGLDRSPIDVHDPEQRRWLEACVWPDQTDRFERLRAALALATESSVEITTGDAIADTPGLARGLGAHPVITNTWVLNYLSGAERAAYLAALDELGREGDISWVFAECPVLVPDLPVADRRSTQTALVLVRWRAGRRTVDHLGDAHPHGYWLHWR
ncbi:MAG: DUF2332 domain-containing protein [Ilumatobacteraceae bacterium]